MLPAMCDVVVLPSSEGPNGLTLAVNVMDCMLAALPRAKRTVLRGGPRRLRW